MMRFFQELSSPMHTGMAAGAVSLKKPHHIITLQFSEVVKDHANRGGIGMLDGCFVNNYAKLSDTKLAPPNT